MARPGPRIASLSRDEMRNLLGNGVAKVRPHPARVRWDLLGQIGQSGPKQCHGALSLFAGQIEARHSGTISGLSLVTALGEIIRCFWILFELESETDFEDFLWVPKFGDTAHVGHRDVEFRAVVVDTPKAILDALRQDPEDATLHLD
jgi:hypothetical protein